MKYIPTLTEFGKKFLTEIKEFIEISQILNSN
jgi:hypothetical protein